MDDRLNRYFREGGFESLPGACLPIICQILFDLNEIQFKSNIFGDVAEIGVDHGRLLIALALLTREEECAVAIDVFDVNANYGPTGGTATLTTLQENFRRFHGDSSCLKVLIGDSLLLTAADVRPSLQRGRIRLFSVDGAHSYFHTVSDIQLAEQLVCPGAVVMVDDISNMGWPGVMEGVARYFLSYASRKFFPFMIGYNKLWLTTYDFHKSYFDYALERAPLLPGLQKRVTRFFGTDVVGF